MPFAPVNDINIYYEIHGSGEPLVLINGMAYDLWMWHKMVPGLAERFQVITFDNRGIGQTDKPDGPYSAQMLADDTAGLLDALSIERAAVLGISMGGFVAQALVLGRPDLVGKLILSATNFGGPNAILPSQEVMAILLDTKSDAVERTRRGIEVSTAPGFAEANAPFLQEWLDYRIHNPVLPVNYQAQLAVGLGLASAETAFEHKLKNVVAPTLILFGEFDNIVPPANAELLAQEIPDSKIVLLKNAGHYFFFEVPDTANEAIVSFLKE